MKVAFPYIHLLSGPSSDPSGAPDQCKHSWGVCLKLPWWSGLTPLIPLFPSPSNLGSWILVPYIICSPWFSSPFRVTYLFFFFGFLRAFLFAILHISIMYAFPNRGSVRVLSFFTSFGFIDSHPHSLPHKGKMTQTPPVPHWCPYHHKNLHCIFYYGPTPFPFSTVYHWAIYIYFSGLWKIHWRERASWHLNTIGFWATGGASSFSDQFSMKLCVVLWQFSTWFL